MKKWWRNKRAKRKRKGQTDDYSLAHFLLDVITAIPELLLFPGRVIVWLFRGLLRLVGNFFDVV